MHILSLLLLRPGLQDLRLQAAPAAKGLSEPLPWQSPPPRSLLLRARRPPPRPATSSAGAPTTKTAKQWMEEGRKAQKAGNQMEAVNDFLNAQRLEPASPDPLYSLGMSFFLIGWDENDSHYYDRAARHFESALALDPKYDRAAFMRGMMEVVHFRLKEAEPYHSKGHRLEPSESLLPPSLRHFARAHE